MINHQIAQTAFNTAQQWENNNLRLSPVQGSLLDKLVIAVSASRPQTNINEQIEGVPEDILAYANASFEKGASSPHELAEIDAAREIAAAIRLQFNFARNTVRPIVLAAFENLKESAGHIPQRAEYTPVIVKQGPPAPLNDIGLQESLEAFKHALGQAPIDAKLCIRDFTAQEILEVLAPGSRAFDHDTLTWLAGMGESWIMQTWDAVFSNKNPITFRNVITNPQTGDSAALLIYLATANIMAHPPKDVVLTGDECIMLATLREQSAARLLYVLQMDAHYVSTQRLIISFNEKQVVVAKTVYDKWIEDGGSEAILFGSTLLPNPPTYVGAVIERAKDALEQWERQNRLLTRSEDNKRLSRLRHALVSSCERAVTANVGLAYAHLYKQEAKDFTMDLLGNETHQKTLAGIIALVQTVQLAEFDEAYVLCRKIITQAVFPYCNALDVLSGIDKVAEEKPEYNGQECALIMSQRLIATYLRDQITISELARVA